MSIVNFQEYRASCGRRSTVQQAAEPLLFGKSVVQRVAFRGPANDVVDAVLKWLSGFHPDEQIELAAGSDTLLLVGEGSIEFVEYKGKESLNAWLLRRSSSTAGTWPLAKGAEICFASVLNCIIEEQRFSLLELMASRDAGGTWDNNEFVAAMNGDKDHYYAKLGYHSL